MKFINIKKLQSWRIRPYKIPSFLFSLFSLFSSRPLLLSSQKPETGYILFYPPALVIVCDLVGHWMGKCCRSASTLQFLPEFVILAASIRCRWASLFIASLSALCEGGMGSDTSLQWKSRATSGTIGTREVLVCWCGVRAAIAGRPCRSSTLNWRAEVIRAVIECT